MPRVWRGCAQQLAVSQSRVASCQPDTHASKTNFPRPLPQDTSINRAAAGDFSYWPEADVVWARKGVRFQGESGHDADWLSLPSLTQSRRLPGE